MTRKVLIASFHTSSNYVQGLGDVGKTLPSGTKTLDDLDMTVSELGLSVKFKSKNKKFEVLFPLAAVQLMTLAPEDV